MSDRRRMIAFISSQRPEAERTVLIGDGPGGPVVAHVSVMEDDIEIASNGPESVTLREVYEQFRWNSMTSWERQAAIRPAGGQKTASPMGRIDEIAGRLVACLSAVGKTGGDDPSDAPAPSAGRSRSPSQQDAMTTRDVAELLGCSYTGARERLLDGRIRAVKDGRRLRTRREWVEEYIARNTVHGVQDDPDVHSAPVPKRKRPCQFKFKKGDAAMPPAACSRNFRGSSSPRPLENVPKMLGVLSGMVVVRHDHLRGLAAESFRHFVDVESPVFRGPSGPGAAIGVWRDLLPDEFIRPCRLESDERGLRRPGATVHIAKNRPGGVLRREPVHDLVQLVTDADHSVLPCDPARPVFAGVQPPQAILRAPRLDLGDLSGSCAGEPHRLKEVTIAVVFPELERRLVFLETDDDGPTFDLR